MAGLAGGTLHRVAAGGYTPGPVERRREMSVMAVGVAAAPADGALMLHVVRPVERQVAAEGQLAVAHSLLDSPA